MTLSKMLAKGWSAFGGKIKNVFLLTFLMAGFFLTLGVPKAFAGACLSGGGTCWTLDNSTDACSAYSSGGKLLISVSAGDVACAAVYAPPVKCCKVGTVSSTKPAAVTKGADSTTTSTTTGGTTFTNPLEFTNVEGFLGGILSAIQKIIVVLALVFIMIGAMMILTSAGNSGMVEKGKGAITMALVGLALGVAAPSLLKELASIIGWIPRCNPGDVSCVNMGNALTLSEIAVRVLNFLLGTMGIVALVMLVIGAILYLTSAGDEDRIDKGKEIFKYSLIGLVLAMSSMVLVTQIAQFFTTTPNLTTTLANTTNTSINVPSNAGGRPMPNVPAASAVPSNMDQTTACQSAGGSPGEFCTVMVNDSSRPGQYLMPLGMDCVWRSVCSNNPMQGCCRSEVASGGKPESATCGDVSDDYNADGTLNCTRI